MATIEALVDRVERLLLRHEALRSAHELLLKDRDSLRSRLHAARSRIDALLDRLPDDAVTQPAAQMAIDAGDGDGDGANARAVAAVGAAVDGLGKAKSADHVRSQPGRRRAVKQIEVTILGQSYVLGAPGGGEDALMAAVKHVDREMTAIRDAGKVRARERIAVLAALNLAYALAQRGDDLSSVGASGTPPGDAVAPEVGSGVDLGPLLRRLDDALAGDGRLL